MSLPTVTMLLLSGGMDSVTLLHDLHSQGVHIHSLIFDYGQIHAREIGFARMHCDELDVPYTVIELHRIKGLFSHSSLTDGQGTVIVPNRNAVLLNIAAAIAMGANTQSVCIGCNRDDYEQFPDCRQRFFTALQITMEAAEVPVEVCVPYILLSKMEIGNKARELGVDLAKTWSCYGSGPEPCGKCLACRKREEALR